MSVGWGEGGAGGGCLGGPARPRGRGRSHMMGGSQDKGGEMSSKEGGW